MSAGREAALVVAGNLALFIAVASAPWFQAAHHHWIFPLLAAPLAAQWALLARRPGARGAVLGILAFLLIMGLARHESILACFGRCGFKLAATFLIAAAVFAGEAARAGSRRARWGAGACLLLSGGWLLRSLWGPGLG